MSANTEQHEMLLRQFYIEQGKLRGYIFSSTRDYHATEDILQEVSIAIVKDAGTFDTSRPPLPWFMGIARNQIYRFYRKKARDSNNVSFEAIGDCLPYFETFGTEPASSSHLALKRCMSRLPGKQQKVVELRYMDDMNCTQIANALGRSVQSIYSLLKRMKKELRKCVEYQLAGDQL